MGCIIPKRGYFNGLSELCKRHGALLIIDEGLRFRLGRGGARNDYDIDADLVCLGKIVEGLPRRIWWKEI